MATGARGEGTIETQERAYPLLFTNRALAEAEKALDCSIFDVAQAAQAGRLSLSQVAELLRVGLEYGRREAKWGKDVVRLPLAYDVLEERGYPEVARLVLEGLFAVLAYDPDEAEDEGNPPA